ncbi:MAG: methyltransferase domain-containing protein [Phycisphaerae bacterium]
MRSQSEDGVVILAARDHIAKAYLGHWGSKKTIERARNRIHWLGGQVTGKRVLDVGCSEGILPILLGREGFEVVGVDLNKEAIDFAQDLLLSETQVVQERVRFVCANITTLDAPQDRFDTLLLGEVIEHVVNPSAFLATCMRHVKPGGTCILTTPFGLSPHNDHKQTFVASELVKLLSPFLEIRHLSVAYGYLRVVGAARDVSNGHAITSGAANHDPEFVTRLLHETEQATLESQYQFYEELDQIRSQRNRVEANYKNAVAERDRMSERAAALESEAAALQKEIEQSKSQGISHQALLESRRQDLDAEKQRAEEAREKLAAQVQRVAELTNAASVAAQEATERESRIRAEQETLQRMLVQREERLAAMADSHRLLANQRVADKRELEALEAQLTQLRAQIADEEKRRTAEVRKLEGRLRHQLDQLNYFQAELALKKEEVRYQIGDAFVSATKSPLDFVRLPGRLFTAFLRGRARGQERKRLEQPASHVPMPVVVADKVAKSTEKKPVKHDARRNGVGKREIARELLAPPILLAPGNEHAPLVAGILDTMSASTFGQECRLLTFAPHNWQFALEQHRPDFLLVESAWQGNSGTWQYQVGEYSGQGDQALRELTDWCRKNNIPTVFWNKEDPVHFTKFRRSAALFDYVFTSDANMISDYRALSGNRAKHVDALTFSAQPALHNPITTEPRLASPCFAGSFYANRHLARRHQMEALLDAAMPFGLVIYDRNFGKGAPDFQFPARFQPAIQGSLPYEEVVETYKRHKVFLNVNSVTESPTMFSRRVFELLACGTAVLSTPSVGMAEMFGDIVEIAETQEEFQRILEKLTKNEGYWRQQVRKGRRVAFAHHTTRHRLRQIAEAIGLDVFRVTMPEYVAQIRITTESDAERLARTLQQQTRQPAAIHLIVEGSLPRDTMAARFENALPGRKVSIAKGTDDAVSSVSGEVDWAAYFHATAEYDEHYAEDLLLCSRFAEAQVIGHAAYSIRLADGVLQRRDGVANSFTDRVHPHACIVRVPTLKKRGWIFDSVTPADWTARLPAADTRVYASDGEGITLRVENAQSSAG